MSNEELAEQIIDACATGRLDQLKILISQYQKRPAPIMPTPEYLLQVAAKNGQVEAIRLVFDSLPKNSGRPSYPWDPETPPGVFFASIPDKWKVYEFCIVHAALEGSNPLGVFKLFFEYGMEPDFNLERAINTTARAIANNHVDLVEFFLSQGAKPTGRYLQPEDTYLGNAAALPAIEMLKLLIKNGAKLEGSQALRQAVQNGRLENAKYLLNLGADINEAYTYMNYIEGKEVPYGSPLHWAIKKTPWVWREEWQKPTSQAETVRFLLSRGAKPDSLDKKGRTPFQIAAKKDLQEVIGVFKEFGVER